MKPSDIETLLDLKKKYKAAEKAYLKFYKAERTPGSGWNDITSDNARANFDILFSTVTSISDHREERVSKFLKRPLSLIVWTDRRLVPTENNPDLSLSLTASEYGEHRDIVASWSCGAFDYDEMISFIPEPFNKHFLARLVDIQLSVESFVNGTVTE